MKLARYLSRQGISKKAFADRLGVTEEAVRLWCQGERTPRWKAIQAIRLATEGKVDIRDFEPEQRVA